MSHFVRSVQCQIANKPRVREQPNIKVCRCKGKFFSTRHYYSIEQSKTILIARFSTILTRVAIIPRIFNIRLLTKVSCFHWNVMHTEGQNFSIQYNTICSSAQSTKYGRLCITMSVNEWDNVNYEPVERPRFALVAVAPVWMQVDRQGLSGSSQYVWWWVTSQVVPWLIDWHNYNVFRHPATVQRVVDLHWKTFCSSFLPSGQPVSDNWVLMMESLRWRPNRQRPDFRGNKLWIWLYQSWHRTSALGAIPRLLGTYHDLCDQSLHLRQGDLPSSTRTQWIRKMCRPGFPCSWRTQRRWRGWLCRPLTAQQWTEPEQHPTTSSSVCSSLLLHHIITSVNILRLQTLLNCKTSTDRINLLWYHVGIEQNVTNPKLV